MKLVIDGKTWNSECSKKFFAYGKTESVYVVENDGIYEKWNEPMTDICGNDNKFVISNLILPKEVFMAAYNAYIKGEK